MSIRISERTGDVKIYGDGALGGKGAGLAIINESPLPRAKRLKTWILTTNFYDRFLERDREFGDEELEAIRAVLGELGDDPVGVRSSATNEAGVSYEAAKAYGTPGNYVNGANIAGFLKVADAMMAQGIV